MKGLQTIQLVTVHLNVESIVLPSSHRASGELIKWYLCLRFLRLFMAMHSPTSDQNNISICRTLCFNSIALQSTFRHAHDDAADVAIQFT